MNEKCSKQEINEVSAEFCRLMTKWDMAKDYICFDLTTMAKKGNLPNVRICGDLIASFFVDLKSVKEANPTLIPFGSDEDVSMKARVTCNLLNDWGVDVNQLFDVAKKNSARLLPGYVLTMKQLIGVLMFGGKVEQCFEGSSFDSYNGYSMLVPDDVVDTDSGFYVVGNFKGIGGAAVMLYDGLLERVAEKYNGDIYILPSSIHEVIMLPANKEFYKDNEDALDQYIQMVCEINQTQVAERDRLSDNVFIYKREDKKIHVA